jgi:hypothetical protein
VGQLVESLQALLGLPEDAAEQLVDLLGEDPDRRIEQQTFVSAALGWWAAREQVDGPAGGREDGEAGLAEVEEPEVRELGHRLSAERARCGRLELELEDSEERCEAALAERALLEERLQRAAGSPGGEGSGQEAGRRAGDHWPEPDRSRELEERCAELEEQLGAAQGEAKGGGRQVEQLLRSLEMERCEKEELAAMLEELKQAKARKAARKASSEGLPQMPLSAELASPGSAPIHPRPLAPPTGPEDLEPAIAAESSLAGRRQFRVELEQLHRELEQPEPAGSPARAAAEEVRPRAGSSLQQELLPELGSQSPICGRGPGRQQETEAEQEADGEATEVAEPEVAEPAVAGSGERATTLRTLLVRLLIFLVLFTAFGAVQVDGEVLLPVTWLLLARGLGLPLPAPLACIRLDTAARRGGH